MTGKYKNIKEYQEALDANELEWDQVRNSKLAGKARDEAFDAIYQERKKIISSSYPRPLGFFN